MWLDDDSFLARFENLTPSPCINYGLFLNRTSTDVQLKVKDSHSLSHIPIYVHHEQRLACGTHLKTW